MKQTNMTERARKIALEIWGDNPDKTGYPRMNTLDRMVEQITDPINGEYIASIIYVQDLYKYAHKTKMELFKEGIPMRVACAAERLILRDGDTLEDFIRRIAGDTELALPAALIYTDYLKDPSHYKMGAMIVAFVTLYYSTINSYLKEYSGQQDCVE